MAVLELGPIWRSLRRHRAFALMVLEVTVGFFLVINLMITVRWFASIGLPRSGHREVDLVEISTRAPAEVAATAAGAMSRQRRERELLAALPGASIVVPVSSTQIDDRWGLPNVFWTTPGAAVGPSACPDVRRSKDGVVVGWGVDAGATLGQAIDLTFIAGQDPVRLPTARQPGTAIITRCLAQALFGDAPAAAVGQRLYSNRHPAAVIVGVIEDVRMRGPFLYQTQVTAIFTAEPVDERVARYLVRTSPGRAPEVRDAAAALLSRAVGSSTVPGLPTVPTVPTVPTSSAASAALNPDYLVKTRLFDISRTRSAGIARGTVVVLLYVGFLLGLLAILGNFAVAAFLVGDRRRVIGVRRALGATRWDILRYLLIENLVPTQLGNLVGLIASLLALPSAQKLFSGLRVEVRDVVATALLLSLVGVLAKLLPALRATRIPPSEVSRAL